MQTKHETNGRINKNIFYTDVCMLALRKKKWFAERIKSGATM